MSRKLPRYNRDDDHPPFINPFNTTSHEGIHKIKGPGFKRPGALNGYTGHYQKEDPSEHILDSPNKKLMIRGYTGFRPHLKNLCGEPLIPSEEKQLEKMGLDTQGFPFQSSQEIKAIDEPTKFNFRAYGKHMDTVERYAEAVQHLLERGQSQEMLLRIVQAKMSERVNSYSAQLIRTRKLFEAYDLNGDGVLDEGEFRICLEKLNIQFDDVQNCALFAYFDDNNDGYVEWKDFADHAMIHNPQGGTAVVPKIITQLHKNETLTKFTEARVNKNRADGFVVGN